MRSFKYAVVASALALSVGAQAQQQQFPKDRPIMLVVPWAPGGNVDVTARVVAPGLSEILGQPVIVENRAGAGGFIGSTRVVQSEPDGHTLLLGSSGSISIGPAIANNAPYDSTKDLIAVGPIHSVPLVLTASGKSDIKSLSDFLAKAKANPGALSVGSAGNGSTQHLAIELLALRTGTKLNHIPYRGSGPALNDLVGGQVETMIDQMTSSLPFIKKGDIRAIAVTNSNRSAQMPDVPTVQEQGIPDMDMTTYTGIFAPAGTPPAVVAKISDALKQVMQRKDVRDRFEALGVEILQMDQPAFQTFVNRDFANSRAIGKAANISIN